MSVYKNKVTKKWDVSIRFKSMETGKYRQTMKRGFHTKKDAEMWEMSMKMKDVEKMYVTFEGFYENYMRYKTPRIKDSTLRHKKELFENYILPYFKDMILWDIKTTDVIAWQNYILSRKTKQGNLLKGTYIRDINNQLKAIFNYAVKIYGLDSNPVSKLDPIGEKEAEKMRIWTEDEYFRFIEAIGNKEMSFYMFELLYWCGIRKGEMLALTKGDFNLGENLLSITKTYRRVNRKDIITSPKTRYSNRVIYLPEFLTLELKDYFKSKEKISENSRLFPVTESYVRHEMARGIKEASLERIRIHDLRHSHVSLLIHLGFNALEIADRLGHSTQDITYRYAHLFPDAQMGMAQKLNMVHSKYNS